LEAGTGNAVTSGKHATHFQLPTMQAELVDRQDFIPAKLAESKMHAAMLAYNSARAAFEERIAALQAHHESSQAQSEQHFQRQAAELRDTALRHVEVQRRLKKQLEDKLQADIKARDSQIEDLRDAVADLSSEVGQKGKVIDTQARDLQEQGSRLRRLEVEQLVEIALVGRVVTEGTAKEYARALGVAARHEQSALEEEVHNTQFMADKLLALEQEHAAALKKSDAEHAAAVQKLQKGLTEANTKYVSLQWHSSGALAKAERRKAELHAALVASEVHICMTDLLDQVALVVDASLAVRPGKGSLKRLGSVAEGPGSAPLLSRKSSQQQSKRFISFAEPEDAPAAVTPVKGPAKPADEAKEVSTPGSGRKLKRKMTRKGDVEEGAGRKDSKGGLNFHIDTATHGTESIQALQQRAQADLDELLAQYNAAVRAVGAAKRTVLSSKKTAQEAQQDGFADAPQLQATHEAAKKEYSQVVAAKEALLELKIEAEARMTMLRDQIAQLELDEGAAPATPNTTSAAVAGAGAGAGAAQLSASDVLNMQAMATERKKQGQDMEHMEDALVSLKAELEVKSRLVAGFDEERAVLQEKMAELIAEKRSDVLARLGEEVEAARKRSAAQAEELALQQKASAQQQEKIKEQALLLQHALDELKIHDEHSKGDVGVDAEKKQLQEVIAKQRAEVASKAKAATAGWNAAAAADEEKAVLAQQEYDRGYYEAMNKRQADNKDVGEAIEKKDARITELVLELQGADDKIRAAQKETEAAKAAVLEAQLEVSDTIASFAANGGDSENMVSKEDLERARLELDAAQEEVVALQERLEQMSEEAKTAAKTITVLEQLRAAAVKDAGVRPAAAVATVGGFGAVSANAGPSKLAEVTAACKAAIINGSNLWKQSKRDECQQLYMSAVEDAISKLNCAELVSPLQASVEQAHGQDVAKGAVTLRKALDQLLVDAKTPQMKKAEDSALTALAAAATEPARGGRVVKRSSIAPAAAAAPSPLVQELESELGALKKQLEQSEKEKQAARAEAKAQRQAAIAAGETVAEETNASASLLSRAQAAERAVGTLKKQLATMAVSMQNAGAAKGGKADSKTLERDLTMAQVEQRRLQRRVTTLEEALKGGSSGGPAPESRRAQIQAEKAAAKKFKDMEADYKKQLTALERTAKGAEKSLQKLQAEAGPAVEERDSLRGKVRELAKAAAEMEEFKTQVQEIPRLREESARLAKELSVVSETLKKESALRKKYKNDLEDMKGAIRVYARCRPMAKYEIERGCSTVVRFTSDETLTVTADRGVKDFTFDQVFDQASEQEAVFEDTRMLVESCLDGYNVCLFAYGQTGSGKTFTMTGSPALPGLTPRAIDELFRLRDERASTGVTISIKTYFVELYLDAIVDLYFILDSKGKKGAPADPPKLDIKLDNKKMVYISNCVVKDAADASELMSLFNRGNAERHVGATKMNAESSRSHSIFAILIESYDPRTKRTTMGKLSLVDLAGSERADKTGATADRLKEGIAINKSLSALGDVISALSTGEKIIPYRNSKLTQMMQDSLGGNAKTLMFVNFSPADYNADETVAALNYATRVKTITNDASKAAESAEVGHLKSIIKKLKAGQELDEAEAAALANQ